jgi:hypothetical protein
VDNIQFIISEWVVGIFSLGMMYYSFLALNQCDKKTKISIRLPLVTYFGSAVGAFILCMTDFPIHWSYALIVVGVTLHLAGDRRQPRKAYHYKHRLL